MVLWDLTVSWGRIGLVGFGGGPGMVPLMKAECVDVQAWMTDGEFLEALALGYSLPGPIAAKMSVCVGMKAGGVPGALVAFAAVMGPAIAMMMGLASLFFRYREQPLVAGAMSAVKPIVIALLAWTVIELAPDGVKGWTGVLFATAALAALLLRVHPALVMMSGMAVGALMLR